MKKKLLIIALAVVLCLTMITACACKDDPIDPSTQSLTISNSTDLMKKWNVGEADRTVEVELTDGLKDKVLTITAEPEGIISVDGTTLHAEKNGTATVTATVVLDEEHVFSDSIEIKVTYNYELQITNKSDLTKAFRLGQEDREVKIDLPQALNGNTVTIVSSKSDVVSVVGNKIHAVSEGEATITASTTLNGVTFSDSFKVTVWGEFDLQVANIETLEQPISKDSGSVAIDVKLINAGDNKLSDVSITSADETIAKIENGAIVPVACGETVITVSCDGKTVTINIKIEVLPELVIAEYDESQVFYVGNGEGNGIVLPEVLKATDSTENPVEEVTITAEGIEGLEFDKASNTLYSSEIGIATVTYSFVDEATSVTKQVTINVTFAEKLFSATGAHVDNDSADRPLGNAKMSTTVVNEEESYKQVTTFASDDLLFGKLDVPASKLYYAEATFAVGNVTSSVDATLAMAHFSTENDRYALLSKLASYSGDFLNIDLTFNVTDNVSKGSAEANGQTCMYAYKLFSVRHFDRLEGDTGAYTETSLVTIAIARDGDYFYTFVNGQYLNCLTPANLRNVDTVPAIVGKWLDRAETEISNIQYLYEQSAVQAKLDDLLGVNKEKMIVPYTDSNDSDTGSHSQSFGDNVKIDTNITDSGLAFNYINGTGALDGSNNQNGSAISPYVYFDGNFTFSWEYKVTDVQALGGHNTSNADGYRSMLELKDYTIGYDIVQLGMGSNSSNKTAASKFEMNVKGYDGKNGYKVYGEPSTNDAGVSGLNSITTIGTTIRFSMTRVLQEKHAIYILSATVLDTNGAPTEKTYTRMVIFGDATMKSDKYAEAQEKWAEPVLPYWRNSGFSGQFTNVQWQLLPNDIDVSAVAETTESTDVTLNNNAFTITLDNLITTNATFNLSETLTAGEYTVKIIALGDNTLGSSASKDLQELVVYEKEISLDAGAQYLKLDGITLGHGTYQIQIIPKAE